MTGNYVLVPGTYPENPDMYVPGTVLGLAETKSRLMITVQPFNGSVIVLGVL